MDNESRQEFDKIWAKIKELESMLPDHVVEIQQKNKVETKKSYKGLAGGIRLLIDNGFFNSPKSVKEIHEELKREGYHYSYASADKLIRVDLHKIAKTLNRIKAGKTWSYVLRK